jgi:hypothetical protein
MLLGHTLFPALTVKVVLNMVRSGEPPGWFRAAGVILFSGLLYLVDLCLYEKRQVLLLHLLWFHK